MGYFGSSAMPSVAIVCSSRGFSGRLPIFVLDISLELYLTVSGAAQKECWKFALSHLKTAWNDDVFFVCIHLW